MGEAPPPGSCPYNACPLQPPAQAAPPRDRQAARALLTRQYLVSGSAMLMFGIVLLVSASALVGQVGRTLGNPTGDYATEGWMPAIAETVSTLTPVPALLALIPLLFVAAACFMAAGAFRIVRWMAPHRSSPS